LGRYRSLVPCTKNTQKDVGETAMVHALCALELPMPQVGVRHGDWPGSSW